MAPDWRDLMRDRMEHSKYGADRPTHDKVRGLWISSFLGVADDRGAEFCLFG